LARRQLTIDNEIAAELAGSGDAVLRRLEDRLDCDLYLRGNVITLDGGAGHNSYQYLQNAPVHINGGAGNDTVIITGTPIADVFIVTDQRSL